MKTTGRKVPDKLSGLSGKSGETDWWLPQHRLVDAAESTARSPGNDWSISWHRLVDAGMAGTRKSGVCKELIY